MRPTELENLLKTMRTAAPGRLDRRVYATIDLAVRQPRPRMSVWRIIMQSPITKLAIAAALIIGTLFLARILLGQEPSPVPSRDHVVKQRPKTLPTIEPSVHPTPPDKLTLARRLYQQRNQAGLLDLLSHSPEPTQIVIAGYLGEIGDNDAIPALQKLADTWQGPGANPYTQSIESIKSRATAGPNEPNLSAPNEVTTPAHQQTQDNPPQRDVTIRGVVRNEQGDPVAGVKVWGLSRYVAFKVKPVQKETRTDTEGHFALAVGDSLAGKILLFDHSDYAQAWVDDLDIHDPCSPLKIVLDAPASVAGVVMDQQGQPIEKASVECWIQQPKEQGFSYFARWQINGMEIYTDAQGRFRIERLPKRSRLHLRVTCEGYGLYSTFFEYPSVSAYPIRAGDQQLKIGLKPGGMIEGRVVYPNGQAYADPTVIVVETHGAHELVYHTDEQGRFVTTGLTPGLYKVNIMTPQQDWLCAPQEVQVESIDQATEVQLIVRQKQPVDIHVIDEETGQSLPHVFVYAVANPEGGTTDSRRSDSHGKCQLHLPPGDYRICVQEELRYVQKEPPVLTVGSDTQDGISLEVPVSLNPMIHGQLFDVNGLPIAGTVTFGRYAPQKTDDQGCFSIPIPMRNKIESHLGEDYLCYAFDRPGQQGLAFFWQQSQGTRDLILVLHPLASITGRIVGSQGNGLSEVTPKLQIKMPNGNWLSNSNNPWQLTLDEDGIFVFMNVPVGLSMQVFAEKPGFQGWSMVEKLVGGQTVDVGDVVLKGISGMDESTQWTGILRGQIINEKGEPVTGCEVMSILGTTRFTDVTDRKGRFTLKDLPQGKTMNIGLSVPGYGHCSKKVLINGQDVEMQIFPQGWDLLGKTAPEIKIAKWFNSDPVILSELRGHVVLLQIGVLLPLYDRDLQRAKQMYEKYSEQGLEIIAIHQPLSMDWAGNVTEDDIEKYLADQAVPFIFCLDKGSGNGETYAVYDIKAIPATYLIDKKATFASLPNETS